MEARASDKKIKSFKKSESRKILIDIERKRNRWKERDQNVDR